MWKNPQIGAFIFDTLILLTLTFFYNSTLNTTKYRHISNKSIQFQSNQAFSTFLYSACQITALQRSSGANAMFSISNSEFEVLIYEFLKINSFTASTWQIMQPYYFHEPNLLNCIHIKNGSPQYEYSVMSYLNFGFSKGEFKNIFGNYTDYLSYVPTNLGREMDILLMYCHPKNEDEILSYDIIEVKRNKFDKEALKQLIDYESWFLMKKVSGDLNMVRTSAIAESFSDDVIHYVQERKVIENKTIKLITYHLNTEGNFILNCINK